MNMIPMFYVAKFILELLWPLTFFSGVIVGIAPSCLLQKNADVAVKLERCRIGWKKMLTASQLTLAFVVCALMSGA